MIYFDHNATAPISPEARRAWLDACERYPGNPSSPHRLGSRAEAVLNAAREKLAAILGCDALDIVWTSGATEANNLALHHTAAASPSSAEVWVSAIEHPSVLEPCRNHFPGRHRLIPVTRTGVIDLDWLETRLKRERPALVVCLAANNETGVLQPWKTVLDLCRRAGVSCFCDATQWIGKLPGAGLGSCDLLSGSAHKFGGPKGVGFLKCPSTGPFRPLLLGGPQEEGRRAGTENLPGVLSMVAALEAREAALARDATAEPLKWRLEFEKALCENLPGTAIVGSGEPRLWNTVAALMPEIDCRKRWVVKLDKLGFAVSTGSACSSGKEEPSHVLKAMGYTDAEAGRALRFSSGWETQPHEWTDLLEALKRVFASAG